VAVEQLDPQGLTSDVTLSVLLVDADESLCGVMGQVLPYYGMRLSAVHNGYLGLREALEGRHDLVLLDVRLPGLDGFELLRQIRRRSPVPIIMLTARSDESDRVTGLDAGADDYLAKPFGIDELLARMRAVLRRTGRATLARPERLEASGLVLETGVRDVRVAGQSIAVTSTEYEILEYLVRHAGRIVPRDELMMVVCQREASSLDRSLDVHISRLRRKLASRASLIRTVRGVGYLFCVDTASDVEAASDPLSA
jgi:two-component system, OmpR family, response regulator CpxR